MSTKEKPAHYCPDWDFDWILPNSQEMACCVCDFAKEFRKNDGD